MSDEVSLYPGDGEPKFPASYWISNLQMTTFIKNLF